MNSLYKARNLVKLLVILLSLPLTAVFAAAVYTPDPEHVRSTRVINEYIRNLHYKKPELGDDLSSSIFDRYLEMLDPNRHFFLASDIRQFEKYRHRLDDALIGADLSPAFEIYNLYQERLAQRMRYALEQLEARHDWTVDEKYTIDREGAAWATSRVALDDLWRKRVKNDILNLKLADKTSADIQETLTKRYEQVLRRTSQQKGDDIFQLFINSYTNSIDPHTSYFSPHNSENFNINMRLSLEGIGAALQSKNEYTVVQRIIAGGPADLSGALHPGDRIIGVGQNHEDVVDIVGWRLQDVVQKIRGPKGSIVRLLVLPRRSGVDGASKELILVRDKIKLEEQAAKSSIIQDTRSLPGLRIGVIDLPTFYLDFDALGRGDRDYRSTTRDVRRLIKTLKAEGVDGIVIDLRGNGGGSLREATELTGLFIERGPVVQVKGTRGKVEVERDSDAGIEWTGPLAVLVDRNSASASEIFAGAIKDYRRGIIIGEPTFGKGTVQTLIDLNRFARKKENLGQLKVTVAQFFRINGASTQHRGVQPDIVFPTAFDIDEHGERSLDNALPWARIRAVSYRPVTSGFGGLEQLRNRHKSRLATDTGFRFLMNAAEVIKEAQQQKSVSLLEAQRKMEREGRLKRSLKLENDFRRSRGLDLLSLEDKEQDEDSDLDLGEKKEEDPVTRIQVEEAVHILADHIRINQGRLAHTPARQ